ncbi:MAG TPA: YbaB/EbfC family nucleoid-associated protein [Planctomycetota bacterium]|nr:YbaB/EbfC family nucleoid-associated protein [Planctomycetota bacterium]HUW32135.1 YbaB/EbfC family nucleoid-associated protein [Planctomycetota bacterium]
MAKGLGDLSGFIKHAQEMQKKMSDVQESLKHRVVEGSSGGGMVAAYVNGQQELVKIKIDPKAVDPDDVEMLEDLILAATAAAMKKSRELSREEMAKVTGGLSIPGMM